MPINTLEYSKLFQTALDKEAVAEMKTGWMDANAGQVKYSGGAEVKIPKLAVSGLADYDRDSGYVQGSVTYAYETFSMTQDRGRKFQLDSMDVDETSFVPTASAVMGEFQRTKVVPEIDAYRISKLATKAISQSNTEYGYTPAANTVLEKIKAGIKAVKEQGFSGSEIVVHINPDTMLQLEIRLAGNLRSTTWSQGGINTTVPAIDDAALIETPSDRMYTAITLYDGTTSGQTAGGYVKGASAKDVNFLVVGRRVPVAVTKQDKMRIFDPNTYQPADAWAMDYRRYHDIWVFENRSDAIFANIKDAQS